MDSINRPKVGLGVIVIKENKVLLGKRIGASGKGTWCFPGGHLEYFESFAECAVRETKEETGLDIKLINEIPAAITNDCNIIENSHYVTLYLMAKYISDKPKVAEPDKFERWEWYRWNSFPIPLFLPVQNLIKQGYNPFK